MNVSDTNSLDNDAKANPAKLEEITRQLQELETLFRSGDCAPRVLSEFRIAIDNIRQTAWAVQQWTDLQQRHRDPYTVLDVLSKERVRRATQIAKDLTVDLESLELSIDTEGLPALFQAVQGLHERLTQLFRKDASSGGSLV
jgi:DNA repair ATPase RecN